MHTILRHSMQNMTILLYFTLVFVCLHKVSCELFANLKYDVYKR